MTQTEDASLQTVIVAVAANLLTAVAKAAAALLTGSAAMLAETTHSLADTLNEVLLYVGVRRGARRQLRAEAAVRHLDRGQHVVTSSDPTPTAVFLEDSAALVGLALALVALLLHILTGSAVWDGAASLLIGLLLLLVVASLLVRRNRALLIDEAPPADIRERLRQAVAQEPWVAEVAELTAVSSGPRQLLVLAHVVPVDGTKLTAAIGGLRHRLLALPAIVALEVTPVDRRPALACARRRQRPGRPG